MLAIFSGLATSGEHPNCPVAGRTRRETGQAACGQIPIVLSSRTKWAGFFLRTVRVRRPTQRIGDSGSCRKGPWQVCSPAQIDMTQPTSLPHPKTLYSERLLRNFLGGRQLQRAIEQSERSAPGARGLPRRGRRPSRPPSSAGHGPPVITCTHPKRKLSPANRISFYCVEQDSSKRQRVYEA